MTEFLKPSSLQEALQARSAHGDYEVIAGGTDLMVGTKDRKAPAGMIDLFGLAELCGVDSRDDGSLCIGAAVTFETLLKSDSVRRDFSLLHAACREIGAAQIQSRGTIGGNIATSSPVGDSLPALLALGAELQIESLRGERRVPYHEFATGYRVVDLAEDELITAVHLPAQPEGAFQYWRKIGTRRAQSISKVAVAGVASLDARRHICSIQIGLGAVADRSIRATETEKTVLGRQANEETAQLARVALRGEINPIDDLRSTADYRMTVAENTVSRFITLLGTQA